MEVITPYRVGKGKDRRSRKKGREEKKNVSRSSLVGAKLRGKKVLGVMPGNRRLSSNPVQGVRDVCLACLYR